jgi:hypothetical protein
MYLRKNVTQRIFGITVGSINSAGWNNIIRNFMLSKSQNNIRIMEYRIMSCNGASNTLRRDRVTNFGRKYPKKRKKFGKFTCRQREKNTTHMIGK